MVREYISWRPSPAMFRFQVLDLVQWMTLTRATPRTMAHSFRTTGRPLLFWQMNFVLETQENLEQSTPSTWMVPVPSDDGFPIETQNAEMDDEEDEEPHENQEIAGEDDFESFTPGYADCARS